MSLRWGAIPTPWGTFWAAEADGAVVHLKFPGALPALPAPLSPLLRELHEELNAFLAGEIRRFTVPVALTGTEFQLKVWEALGGVPYGETVTYGELARGLGRPRSARAVGQAVGANPIPILVPCHRVVASTGSLGGYGPGLSWKRRLLELERRVVAQINTPPPSANGPHT